jgi:hypothetical protein
VRIQRRGAAHGGGAGAGLARQPDLLKKDLGKAKAKPKFRDLLSQSRAINILSAARLFLFGARDVWFVVALPVYLSTVFGWSVWQVGGFLSAVGDRLRRGAVAGAAAHRQGGRARVPDGRAAFGWAAAAGAGAGADRAGTGTGVAGRRWWCSGGLLLFGVVCSR